jgi:Aspartyl/Asparaginyl beta-hydroxylase
MPAVSEELPSWQRGFALDYLKEFAGVFKERQKPLVFGAFGLIKERDIADALAKGRLFWTGKPPAAVLICNVTKQPSGQRDFAQREFIVPPGVVLVKAFAALSVEAGCKVLNVLRERVGKLVVEIFEEDSIARLCMKAAGLEYRTTKISAGSEIRGVYSTAGLPLIEPLPLEDRATLEIVASKFLYPEDLSIINHELQDFGAENFAQHYSDYNKRKSWTALALRGYSDDPHFIIKPAEMAASWKEEHKELLAEKARWTPAVKQFPRTQNVIGKLGCKFDRVRFMQLRAKDGELSRHADITDREAGTADGFLMRFHIPIRTTPAVKFMGWNERGERLEKYLPPGALCFLDQRKPHCVKNTGAEDRIHLVMDAYATPELRKMLTYALAA